MAQQPINTGNSANDGQGDTLRVACQKSQANFTELYALTGSIQTVANSALSAASSAQSDADQALLDAAAANNAASSAQSAANDAQSDATQALSDAAAAQTTADDALPKAGGTMTGGIDLNGQTITNLPSPLLSHEPATKGYVDGLITALPLEFTSLDGAVFEFFDEYALGAISTLDKGLGWTSNGVVSGGTIVSRTMADGRVHRRLSISNGQYGRTLPWGGFWNRLKICVLWRLNHNTTINPVEGYVGVCSGTTNMVASGTTNNFIGLRWGDGASSLTYSAGTKNPNFNMGTSFRFYSRRGTTSTFIASGSSGHFVSGGEGYLSGIVYEVSRPLFATDGSSVTYTHGERSTDSTSIEFSRSKDSIRRIADEVSGTLASSEADIYVLGSAFQAGTSGAFDQSTGVLDTVNISWSHAPGLELAAIAVRKVQ